MSTLYRLTKEDIPRAVECLKDAFKDDPLWAEVFRDDPNRERSLTNFFTIPLLYGMKYGKACATSAEIEGVAVWFSGKYANLSMWRLLLSGALPYGAKMGKETLRNLAIVSNQLGPDRKKLMKNKSYQYLMIIGVRGTIQGKGLGSKLMEAIKEDCDKEKLHLYLETEKEENIAFYEKHGLRVLQKIMFNKLDVPMWEMAREPN
ncbi:GNAT family N-acetyltransferase [Dethiobacter alkaliphilus]|uniref:GNAT family N-acetyltransferase n=1 Tax=Dethiobacter alkaliphilus TaxID=427926 RepID=UPI0022279E8A|nr:GNAT family N-acetyltransferase [Dethiobacter alkaliphilus]MCW3490195.1 GNAT family N-acetyltransferase [Dethiobacter alkaliphilus]